MATILKKSNPAHGSPWRSNNLLGTVRCIFY